MNLRLRFPDKGDIAHWIIILAGLITIILLNSCSTNKEIRRANRAEKKLSKLTEKFPELLVTDTIRDTVLVQIPSIEFDTIVLHTDTIRVSKDRWRTQVIIRKDSVLISGGCDTIRVNVPIEMPTNKIQPTEHKPMPLKWWQIGLMCLGALFIVLIAFRIALGTLK